MTPDKFIIILSLSLWTVVILGVPCVWHFPGQELLRSLPVNCQSALKGWDLRRCPSAKWQGWCAQAEHVPCPAYGSAGGDHAEGTEEEVGGLIWKLLRCMGRRMVGPWFRRSLDPGNPRTWEDIRTKTNMGPSPPAIFVSFIYDLEHRPVWN